MIPSASSTSISDRVQSQLTEKFLVVLTEQRGVPLVDPLHSARELHRHGAVAGASDHRMVHLLEEVAGRELRQLRLTVGLHDLADGHAGIPQLARRSRRPVRARHHSCRNVSIRSCACPPSRRGRQGGISRPLRFAQGTSERLPLLVGRHRDGDPGVVTAVLVGTGGLVEVLRRRRRPAVPVTGQERAVGGGLDHLLRRDVQSGIDHRRLDEASFARPRPVLERDHQAEQRMEPGVGVTDGVGLEREEIGVSRQPGEPRGVLDHEGERRKIAPRPVEPEAGHPHHDEIGPIGLERVVVESELVQHPRRVVLHDDVARRDQSGAPDRCRADRGSRWSRSSCWC